MLLRHALPNALVPTLNVTALNLAYLVGGVVVVEKVFGYPGFGSLLVDALQLRDLPLIEATVLIAAAVYIAANLMADVGAILLNPRLQAGLSHGPRRSRPASRLHRIRRFDWSRTPLSLAHRRRPSCLPSRSWRPSVPSARPMAIPRWGRGSRCRA